MGVLDLARPEIRAMSAYSYAQWDPAYERLHANENPWRVAGDPTAAGLNRYPEPLPVTLAARLAAVYGVAPDQILLGRGSDEGIDLLCRAFCRAGLDAVVATPPTFGMYHTAASIQGARVIDVPLDGARGFALDVAGILSAVRGGDVKLVFLCSPNNPTGQLLDAAAIDAVIDGCAGRAIVAVDEAYLEFTDRPSLASRVGDLPHLVVLRTLSKAYGLAGARVGAVLAHADVIGLLRKIIPPYALPQPTLEMATAALTPAQLDAMRARVALLLTERRRVSAALARSPLITRVWPSDSNFVLVDSSDPERVLALSRTARLLIRDVRRQPQLGSAVRISIGTPEQNDRLLAALEAT